MRHEVRLPEGDIHLSGHLLYVRKYLQPETFSGSTLYMPEDMQRNSLIVEVIGVGPDVGKPREKNALLGGDVRTNTDAIEVGSAVIVPNDHPLITKSHLDKNEFFVDAGIVEGVLFDAA